MDGFHDEVTAEQIYRWWWSHDAAWYQAVRKKFGAEAANELNREAMKQIARKVAEVIRKRLTRPIEEMRWADVVDIFQACPKLMWSAAMAEIKHDVTEPGEFEVNVTQNYALAMLRRAGSLDTYECPCLEMRAGWFEGLGLESVDNTIVQCLAKGGTACTYRARVLGYEHQLESNDQVLTETSG